MFAKVLLLILALAAAPAYAQEARKSLEGVVGLAFSGSSALDKLAFGSTLASVQNWGGDKLKLERRQLSDGRDVNVLIGYPIMFHGHSYIASFIFGDADRLSRIDFSMFYYSGIVGYGCERHGKEVTARLIALHGSPDSDIADDKQQVRRILMTFGDGGEIRVSYGIGVPSCLVVVSYANAQGKTSDLKPRELPKPNEAP